MSHSSEDTIRCDDSRWIAGVGVGVDVDEGYKNVDARKRMLFLKTDIDASRREDSSNPLRIIIHF